MIKIDRLTKIKDKSIIFPAIEFDLNHNRITALIAPNGYGKSTFIKVLIGALFKTEGSYRIDNSCSMSYVTEESNIFGGDTVEQIITKECILSGVNKDEALNLLSTRKLGIADLLQKRFKKLSKGQKRKVIIARGFISDAKLLILDEPFDGLDTISRDVLIELLISRREQNKGTLLSTHLLYNLDKFIDDVIFFNNKKAGIFSINSIHKKEVDVLSFFEKKEATGSIDIENIYREIYD